MVATFRLAGKDVCVNCYHCDRCYTRVQNNLIWHTTKPSSHLITTHNLSHAHTCDSSLCSALILFSAPMAGWSRTMTSSVIPFSFWRHRLSIRSSSPRGSAGSEISGAGAGSTRETAVSCFTASRATAITHGQRREGGRHFDLLTAVREGLGRWRHARSDSPAAASSSFGHCKASPTWSRELNGVRLDTL